MKSAFFLPAQSGPLAGNHAYDRHMIAALRKAGHDVQVCEIAGRHPLPDDAAIAAAQAAWDSIGDAVPVIDGMCLPACAALDLERATALLHPTISQRKSLPEAARTRLATLEREVLPRLARIIVPSQATAEMLLTDLPVDAHRIQVVEPGIDPLPRVHGSGGPGVALLAVGTVTPRKDYDTLLRALARLPDLDWSLTIVGALDRDPPYAQMLATLAETLKLTPRIRFAGALEGDALEQAWDRADMFVLTSAWEGHGMAVANALKRGLPVAVTRGGAAASLLPMEAGIIVEPGQHADLSKAMRRMIFDTDLRRMMADTAFAAGAILPGWDTQAKLFAAALEQHTA